jgi:hypothetical protein
MEAIAAIAKKSKKGTFKIELPNISDEQEVEVMIVLEKKEQPKKKNYDFSDLAGRLEAKVDWLKYQKEIRSEWP